jgi:antitoxin component of MazEF toxin-antitoxin module
MHQINTTRKQLRKLGHSLSLIIPAPFVKKLALIAGDVVDVDEDGSVLKLKFFKQCDMIEAAMAEPEDCP